MIIFGTRGITTTPDRGTFNCPQCASPQPYNLEKVNRYSVILLISFLINIFLQAECIGQQLENAHIKGNFIKNGEKLPFEVRIEYKIYDQKKTNRIVFFGSDQLPDWKPDWVIKSFKITFDGMLIEFPGNAFNDLGNPLMPSVPNYNLSDPTAFSITIDGSDGAGAYMAVFIIRNGHLVKRIIRSDEFPKGDEKTLFNDNRPRQENGKAGEVKTHLHHEGK